MTADPKAAISRRRANLLAAAVALLLALAVLFSFAPALRNGFISVDDPEYVTANPEVRAGLTLRGAAWALTATRASNWHPLTWLSHMLDVRLFGLDSRGHHLTSLLLHAAATALLFLLLRALTGGTWPAALAAALFGLHPLRVESVAWVAERKDVLAGLLWIATTAAHVGWARRRGAGRLLLVAALFLLGLASKPTLVTLPVALLLLDVWPLGRTRGEGRAFLPRALEPLLLEKAHLFLLAAAAGALTFVVQARAGMLPSAAAYPPGLRVRNALVSVVVYLRKTLWPADLAFPYGHPGERLSWLAAAAAAAGLLLLTALALGQARRRPYLLVGWLWFLATLAPVIGLVQLADQARADRYTYLPLIGVFLALAHALAGWAAAGGRARRAGAAGAVAAALLLLAAATRAQTGHWRDDVRLYAHAAAADPGDPLAHFNLANALRDAGRWEAAEREYGEALAIAPRHVQALCNLGELYIRSGRLDRAVSTLRAALHANPRNALAHNNLGVALARLGDADGALAHYREAVLLDPASDLFRRNLERQSGADGIPPGRPGAREAP